MSLDLGNLLVAVVHRWSECTSDWSPLGCGERSRGFAAARYRGPPVAGYSSTMSKFHEFEMESITGEPVSFQQYAGKVALVVNVASF